MGGVLSGDKSMVGNILCCFLSNDHCAAPCCLWLCCGCSSVSLLTDLDWPLLLALLQRADQDPSAVSCAQTTDQWISHAWTTVITRPITPRSCQRPTNQSLHPRIRSMRSERECRLLHPISLHLILCLPQKYAELHRQDSRPPWEISGTRV